MKKIGSNRVTYLWKNHHEVIIPVGYTRLSCVYLYINYFHNVCKESELIVTLIERQKGSRRFGYSHEFPLTDSQGVSVIQNRRRLPGRRREQYALDDLDDKVHYLKDDVYKTPLRYALNKHDSMVISRVLSQISIDEITFLLECRDPKNIIDPGKLEGSCNLDKFSSDGERTTALMNLGLLSRCAAEGNSSDVRAYNFTLLADRLVKLFATQKN